MTIRTLQLVGTLLALAYVVSLAADIVHHAQCLLH